MPIKIGLAKERKKKLEGELERIVQSIIKLNLDRILLIGSLATGKVHATSDINLIIIKEIDKRFIERLEEFYTQVKPEDAILFDLDFGSPGSQANSLDKYYITTCIIPFRFYFCTIRVCVCKPLLQQCTKTK